MVRSSNKVTLEVPGLPLLLLTLLRLTEIWSTLEIENNEILQALCHNYRKEFIEALLWKIREDPEKKTYS